MTNYALCRRNERPSILERVHPFIFFFLFFLLLLPRQVFSAALSHYSFFRASYLARTRGLHQARLSPVEGKMTSRSFLVGQGEEMQLHTPVRSLSYCRAAVASPFATVELIYEVLPNFKEIKNKGKHRLSFLLFSASSDLSDRPRLLMPSSIPGSTPSL